MTENTCVLSSWQLAGNINQAEDNPLKDLQAQFKAIFFEHATRAAAECAKIAYNRECMARLEGRQHATMADPRDTIGWTSGFYNAGYDTHIKDERKCLHEVAADLHEQEEHEDGIEYLDARTMEKLLCRAFILEDKIHLALAANTSSAPDTTTNEPGEKPNYNYDIENLIKTCGAVKTVLQDRTTWTTDVRPSSKESSASSKGVRFSRRLSSNSKSKPTKVEMPKLHVEDLENPKAEYWREFGKLTDNLKRKIASAASPQKG
jgi:hypothetical protein